jgi:hypothetical protein
MTARVAGIAVLAIWLTIPQAQAGTLVEEFDRGVAAFQDGRFDEASTLFRELHERFGVTSPDLLVNLGSAEFESGRPGTAMVAFHRAERLDPGSAAAAMARVNMDRVRAVLNSRAGEAGAADAFVFGPYHDAWTALIGWASPTIALGVFLAFWTTFFVLMGLWRLAMTPRSRAFRGSLAIASAILMIASGLIAFGSQQVERYRIGVVTDGSARFMDDLASTEASMTLPEGLEVRILETRGGWTRLRLSSGREGWVRDRVLGIP